MAAYYIVDAKGKVVAFPTGGGGSSLPDPVTVAHGGTGAITAALARAALGLALGTDVEAWDADLDALAALSTTGLIARTGAATYVPRTIGAGVGIAVTNGDGVSGAPSIAATSTKLATSVTGAKNDYNPGVSGPITFEEWSGASDATFSGLLAGTTGQLYIFKNSGTKVAYFLNQSSLSSAGNKYTNIATSGPTPVAAGGYIHYVYDGTTWQLTAHEQGAWISWTPSITPNTGGFTGITASPTIYKVSGKSLTMIAAVTGTSSGSPIFFNVPNPSTYTFTDSLIATMYIGQNGSGVAESGYQDTSSTKIIAVRMGNVAWGNGTCTFYVNHTADLD